MTLREVTMDTFVTQNHPEALPWHDAVTTVLDIKDGPCVDCGRTYPRCAMDFDHVYGSKLFTIAQATNGMRNIHYSPNPLGLTARELFLEVEKCQLRCSNCHRIATSERRRKRFENQRADDERESYLPECRDCGGPIVRRTKRGRTPKRCSDCRASGCQQYSLFEAAA